MGDYPDYTDVMQIIGSDVMVPFDIQAAYIMMPVDLQAQYIDLDINIKAATVEKVNVDLVAQTVGNILVDINAQTIANLKINIDAQSVGLYTGGDWEAKAGHGKFLRASGTNLADGETASESWQVTAGKTYYINYLTLAVHAYSDTDREKPQIADADLYNTTDTEWVAHLGGNGGGSATFPSPITIPGGKTVRLRVINRTGHAANVFAVCGGYVM